LKLFLQFETDQNKFLWLHKLDKLVIRPVVWTGQKQKNWLNRDWSKIIFISHDLTICYTY
jgi:hypothetical protein